MCAVLAVGVVSHPSPGSGGRPAASTSSALAGSQGTDATLPDTGSATTVSGHGQFSALQIHVNQTQQLVNQAISINWSGGQPTFSDNASQFLSTFAGDYLQIFECWSASATTDPTPEQCEFGGESTSPSSYPVSIGTAAYERILSQAGWTCGTDAPPSCLSYQQYTQLASTNPTEAYVDPVNVIDDPFQAVDGTVVPASVDYNYEAHGEPYSPFDLNPYFSFSTSNELDFARTYPDGTGQALFRVDTGLEAPGLGCGQEVLDNSTTIPQCWLVIVPRGTPEQENSAVSAGATLVLTSPLSASAWTNHISVPLGFQPIGTSCSINGAVQRIVGGELVQPAIASWQPTLCAKSGAPAYSYSTLSEDTARGLLMNTGSGGGRAWR